MRQISELNEGWLFRAPLNQTTNGGNGAQKVSLPHSAVELPFNYFDEESYQRAFEYEREIPWQANFEGREVYLHFEGVMADARVLINGIERAHHADGYTPFSVRLTEHLAPDTNLLTVVVDGAENPDIPPFGGRIDYLTYAGIYRDVWLMSFAPVFVKSVKIETPDVLAGRKTVQVKGTIHNPRSLPFDGTVKLTLLDQKGEAIAQENHQVRSCDSFTITLADLGNITLWDIDDPALYSLEIVLETEHGLDSFHEHFGFRDARFTSTGFSLNGRPLKILGLNRHQSFPYTGYAQGRASQEKDAGILKFELGCNLVRTSHYPQSKWFLDHCDRIGLLVLEEIPGWQHIGGTAWKKEAVRNVRRMIERDWNHPSIVSWGVRINESPDDHAFYSETNALARLLDTTRQTCGIRKYRESELLEDIYTMNDFSLCSDLLPERTPLLRPRTATGLEKDVPYLVTEFNGHMFPTKAEDNELRQVEHVTRHLEVINAAFANPNIAGCIGWCMFDYNTHKDFGSGDRVCHHGVMTMFREPKFAAYAYASQQDPGVKTIMKPVTYWSRGERDVGGVLPLMVLTNCDEVELRFPDGTRFRKTGDRNRFAHLPHPPVIFDRSDIPEDVLGKWGLKWHGVTINGYLEENIVETVEFAADPIASRLDITPDKTTLDAAEREEVRVIIRALDQAGRVLPFLSDQICIAIDGPAECLGPAQSPLRGGTTGFWLRATGKEGDIQVSVTSGRFETQVLSLEATLGERPIERQGVRHIRALA
ncbi:glycoside hydrolase family 2 protein [Hoeflea prorocentri]|uniref:Glycoside hydrolase family 2 protein n=1 Tax=Hoeflea prorocentri TaxID=1922333 RepID=A0A9X3UIF9_9HYPH|nr:glycoside hydrolase family 2 TIM barrel-domain containing protein [Hoeflea prorocentri]MCY6381932.1 glycoside hydrolase family 2 protein [Hoeflea prorocentri]MDA5399732.1 glycoside hydrolase family 2 protein [Hoeflea prorocentri]